MSRTHKDSPKSKAARAGRGNGQRRNISVRAVRREPVDLRRLSRALISLAMAEAEAESQPASPDTATGSPAADYEVARD